MPEQYVAMRTDESARKWLFNQLKDGKLRQGWGNDLKLNLNSLRKKVTQGSKQALSSEEAACWRGNRRLLSTENDGLKTGDVVLIPKMPEPPLFCLARITSDEYKYEIDSHEKDFGHIRDVELLIETGIHPDNIKVPAGLRRSLRCKSRLWSIDYYKKSIEDIISCLSDPSSVEALSKRADLDEKIEHIRTGIIDELDKLLEKHFRGEELEGFLERVFGRIYTKVTKTGGAGEKGADLRCQMEDGSDDPMTIAVQVKNWRGKTGDDRGIAQLETTFKADPTMSKAILLTLLDEIDDSLNKRREKLQAIAKVPVSILKREETLELILSTWPWENPGVS